MAKLSEEAAKAHTMVDSGGLAPTAMGQRVRLSGGNLTVLDGPFTEAKMPFAPRAWCSFSNSWAAVSGMGDGMHPVCPMLGRQFSRAQRTIRSFVPTTQGVASNAIPGYADPTSALKVVS
jgi:hypothetical protein